MDSLGQPQHLAQRGAAAGLLRGEEVLVERVGELVVGRDELTWLAQMAPIAPPLSCRTMVSPMLCR